MSYLAFLCVFCRRWAVQVRSNLIAELVALVLLATGSAPAFGAEPPIVLQSSHCTVAGCFLEFGQSNILTSVVGPVNVHLVFWLPDGYHFDPDNLTAAGDAAYQQKIEQFIRDLDGSAFYNIISQYYHPLFGYSPNRLTVYSHVETMPFPVSPGDECTLNLPNATLCLSDVQSAVQSFWQKHNLAKTFTPLPGGGFSSNRLTDVMLLYTPAGAEVCLAEINGCAGTSFAAYHSYVRYTSDSGDITFAPYGIMPALPGEALGIAPPYPNGLSVDTVINSSAHELFEAVTNPIGFGWEGSLLHLPHNEVADNCEQTVLGEQPVFGPIDPVTGANMVLNGHPYLAQYMWSNAQLGCTNAFHGQFINFSALPDVPYGSPPFTVTADATSELAVDFVAEGGACAVTSGGTVTLNTTGACTITAFQDGNQSSGGFYEAATPVARSFTVTPGTACAAGSYSTTGFAPCTPAPAGSYVAGTESTSATICPTGTYQPNSGQTSCIAASPGNFVAGVGQTNQTSCPVGYYQPSSGQTSCLAASPGNFVASVGQTNQTSCPVGYYQPSSGQTSCIPASPGNFVAGVGQTNQTSCPVGYYQPDSGQTSCIAASPGSFVAGVGQTNQTSCPVGYYQPNSGQTSCIAASSGNFVGLTGQTAQTACAPGSYQPDSGASSCVLASPGYFVADSGASAQVQCPAGTTSLAGATACNLILFNFTGFFAPVDNPPLVNTMKAGSAVPVKFSLGGNRGLAIFATGYPKSQPIACDSGSPTDSIEETVTAGGSALTYDATTDQYKYVWKTDKAWKGCRQLILQFTDGTTKSALLQFQ